MRYLPMDQAEPGMILAQAIFDSSGRTLVGSKRVLTANYIERLLELGFPGVYVEDELSEGIEVENAIPQELRINGMEAIKKGDIEECLRISHAIVEEIMSKEYLSLDLMDLRSYDDHTYAHSVNVAVLCGVMGMGMDLSRKDLENVVLAALLHDLGKLAIPGEILNKKGRLTPDEFEIMKTHSTISYELIKERWDLPEDVKEAVHFHHENVDGSGYPDGIMGKEQTTFTKMLRVADVFDALISKRPYKKPYSPYEACEYLMGGCGILFDLKCVNTLMKCVPMYPKGTEVELSNGWKGLIYENAGIHNMRPIIKLTDGTLFDLSLRENLSIAVIPPNHDALSNPEKDEADHFSWLKEKETIYVVNEHEQDREFLEKALTQDYEVRCFLPEEALEELLEGNWPALIMLDGDMPGWKGLAIAEQITEITNHVTPILVISTLQDTELVMEFKKLRIAGYVLRPFNEVYIRSEAERIINGKLH